MSEQDARARPAVAGSAGSLLFLREEELRLAQDMLVFGYRDFMEAADPVLTEAGLGRAHQRALHAIGRHPDATMGELLSVLGVTKQSFSRVLAALVARGLVTQGAGRRDRRERRLRLTEAGAALERRLFERQRERLLTAFRDAGGAAVEGFRRVLLGVMSDPARRLVLHGLGGGGRGPTNATTTAAEPGRAGGR